MSRRSLAVGGVLSSLVVLAAGTLALAQDVNVRARTKATQIRRTSVIVGANIRLQGGVAGGQVADIVLNDSGCVDYIVVSYERRYVLVPWTVAEVDFGSRYVTVNITRDRFLQAPSFRGNEWPDLADVQFTQKINTVFNVNINRRERRNGINGDRSRREQDTERDRDRARSEEERKSFDRLQRQTDQKRDKDIDRDNNRRPLERRDRQSDKQDRQPDQPDREQKPEKPERKQESEKPK